MKRWHRLPCLLALLPALAACAPQDAPKYTPEQQASHEAWVRGSAKCERLTDEIKRHDCLVDLPEDLTASKPRFTAEQRAANAAYRKGAVECDKIADEVERRFCFDDLPDDISWFGYDDVDSVPLAGIDHLADHLSVQEFFVDGTLGGRADGASMPGAKLPNIWRPGLTVEVRWNVTNWRDCTGEDFIRRVPVEEYRTLGQMWVHFLANGNVRVVSSNYIPGNFSPNPKYPVPDTIPDKNPWHAYPLDVTCKGKDKQAITKEESHEPH